MNDVVMQQDGGIVSRNTQTEMMISRQAQEVQAAMVIAKRFPRDEVEAFNRILLSCKENLLQKAQCMNIRAVEARLLDHQSGWQRLSHRTGEILILESQNWNRKTGSRRLWLMRGIWKRTPDKQRFSVFRMYVALKKVMHRLLIHATSTRWSQIRGRAG